MSSGYMEIRVDPKETFHLNQSNLCVMTWINKIYISLCIYSLGGATIPL